MSNRWAVKYYPSPDAAWFVTRWDEELAYWEFQGHFPTHAEALAYADRQARTITVTLPRSAGTYVYAAAGKFFGYQLDGEWTVVTKAPEQTALSLLALARKEQQ